jgi:hypothetical protein
MNSIEPIEATQPRPLPEQIIGGIKACVGTLESEYQNRREDGPKGHLMGYCIDQITTLCRMLDELNKLEERKAELEEKLDDEEDADLSALLRQKLEGITRTMEQRMTELKEEFDDLVRDWS